MITKSIIQQLNDIYEIETWHVNRLSEEQAREYHERLIMQGNIITYVEDGELLGYLEFWRITYEQLGRLMCNNPILTDVEDILTGNIALINNAWIKPESRFGHVFNTLGNIFLDKNQDAEYFVAVRSTKHTKPVKVYSRKDLVKLYKKQF